MPISEGLEKAINIALNAAKVAAALNENAMNTEDIMMCVFDCVFNKELDKLYNEAIELCGLYHVQ
jgi:hypothetical protein